jgi:hypothetical protein
VLDGALGGDEGGDGGADDCTVSVCGGAADCAASVCDCMYSAYWTAASTAVLQLEAICRFPAPMAW